MLRIRLTRTGKRNRPHYRIIVTEKRSKRDGGFIENLGHYTPYTNPATVLLNVTEYNNWIGKGAEPSEVVKYLATQAKDNQLVEIKKTKTKKSKKQKAAEAAKVEASSKDTEEKAATETPSEATPADQTEPKDSVEASNSESTKPEESN